MITCEPYTGYGTVKQRNKPPKTKRKFCPKRCMTSDMREIFRYLKLYIQKFGVHKSFPNHTPSRALSPCVVSATSGCVQDKWPVTYDNMEILDQIMSDFVGGIRRISNVPTLIDSDNQKTNRRVSEESVSKHMSKNYEVHYFHGKDIEHAP